jgi:hypothetical protein
MITTVRIRGIDLAYEDVGPTEDGALDGTPLVWGTASAAASPRTTSSR